MIRATSSGLLRRAAHARTYVISAPTLGPHSAAEDTTLKTKLPIYRTNDPETEYVSMGKLREDLHSVARINLEFIKLASVVSMSPEELKNVVVIPKSEKLSIDQRIEKLEQEINDLKKQLK